jgi:hypothetical protein
MFVSCACCLCVCVCVCVSVRDQLITLSEESSSVCLNVCDLVNQNNIRV